MEKKDIKYILELLPAGDQSEQQRRMSKLWLFQLNNKNRASLTESELENSKAEVWQRLEDRLASGTRRVKLWPRIVAVAAAVALVVLGVYFFNYNRQIQENSTDLVAQDVAPGKVGATLTLANGKKIKLSDAENGELANEAGISITKTADGQLVYGIKGSDADPNKINTLSTAKGETYQVRLPDGSMVYLNAASSLTYAASLIERGKRTVRLRGEGYFEISKDKKHPFVVQTDNQEVEVLGTHFNINAYANEPVVKTTLLEGSIRISKGRDVKLLAPGYEALNSDAGIQLNKINVEIAVAWKNKQFMFESENVQTIMRMVERWYDVEVVYTGEITNETFSGGVSRYDNISELLKTLQSTGKVRFKIEGRKVYVTK